MQHLNRFHKFQKFMAALMVFTMLFGSLPAWAAPEDVTINATGTVTPNTWSNTNYVGVDGKVTTIGTDVINSIKTTAAATESVYGIKYEGAGTLSVGSLAGGIDLDGIGDAYGIYAQGTGTTTVSNLGGITANGSTITAGIYSNGSDATDFKNNITFTGTNPTIKATGKAGKAAGIYVEGTGTTTVTGLGGIEANASDKARGIYTNGSDADMKTTVEFAGAGKIEVSSSSTENGANGIWANGKGQTTVSNVGSISAKSAVIACGIFSNLSDTSSKLDVTFTGANSKIITTGPEGAPSCGIVAEGYGATKISQLGKIEATGNGGDVFGIFSNGSDADHFKAEISFSGADSYIKATSTDDEGEPFGEAYGIFAGGKGKTYVSGLGSIEANGSVGAYGIYSNGSDANLQNNITFANGGKITATATGTNSNVSGIHAEGKGKTYVSNLGGIEAKGDKTIRGIFSDGSDAGFETNVSFVATGGYINATSNAGGASGIATNLKGTTTVSNVGGITANGSNATVYGIYSATKYANFKTNVIFADGGTINAYSTGKNGNAYGIGAKGLSEAQANGTTTVLNLSSITAYSSESKSRAYGIYYNGSDASFQGNVSFSGANSKITSTSGSGTAYGIYTCGKGTGTVSDLGGIEANGNTAYGIYYNGSNTGLQNNVSFVATGGYINATGASSNASGIYAIKKGTTTVSNLGSITAEAKAADRYAYGIYSNGSDATFANNVSFKGNGGQAITAKAATEGNAYSIYAIGKGATTVSFEDSILSGKVAQSGDATVTLNFNDKAVWTPTGSGVSGNVSVNMNSGSRLDTRVATGVAQNKTIDLGTGTFTAQQGSKISFDAVTADNGLTTDQIKAASATGTIELGTVNVKDTAEDNWSAAKTATLFDTTTAAGITVTGTTATMAASGREYTFTGLANGQVSAKVSHKIYSLPQVIQANPKEAGEADAFSFNNGDVTLKEDLGTLNNTYRTSGKKEFTIYGNGNTLNANGKGGVTITKDNTLNIEDLNVKGFTTTFATNSGNLYLKDVTFDSAEGVTDILNKEGSTFTTSGLFKGTVYNEGKDSKVELADNATLESTVKGEGEIVVTGTGVTNEADQTLDVVVKETKDLTTTKKLAGNITLEAGSELNASVAGAYLGNGSATNISVGKNAKLTALATNINTDIYNDSDKSVHLTGDTLNYNTGDTLNYNIWENGTTYIDKGAVTLGSGKEITNDLVIESGAAFKAQKDAKISGDIANKGTLDVTNGNFGNGMIVSYGGSRLTADSSTQLANSLGFSVYKNATERATTTLKNVTTSGKLGFLLDYAKAGDTFARTDGYKYNVTGADITLFQEADNEIFNKGDSVTLIDGTEGSYKRSVYARKQGSIISLYRYGIYTTDAGKLMAQYLGKGIAPETKSFSEGRIAGAATITQASDLLAGAGMASAVAAAKASANGAAPFVEISGARGKYNTGSHVDLNSLNVVAGIAQKVNDNVTAGTYIEGGNGRYSSYNEFDSGELRADGDVNYFGAGIFGRYDFNKTDKGNAYVDGAIGAGYTNQDYASENFAGNKARYDAGSSYLKAHATFGYEWKLAKGSIDSYAKYLWARQSGDSVNVTLNDSINDKVNFDSINSHRLRAGFRYTQGIKKTLAWYGGLAYEYEFGMVAKANTCGLAIAEPDLKGGSGMAELGLKFAPLNAHGWRFDAGLQGFTGKRDSLGVRLGAWYEF